MEGIALPSLDPGQPTARQIHAALRAVILSFDLPPGTRIPEAEAGARFGASRTPVREAMAQLREDGLIVTLPSRGNFVTRLSEDAIRGAQFIRQALETAAAGSICDTGLGAAEEGRMTEALAAQKDALDAGDTAAFHAADDAFHAALAAATGLDRVQRLVAREKTALDRLRTLSLQDTGHLRVLQEEHGRILKALRKGRAQKALALISVHLSRVLDVLADLKAHHAEYFE